MHSSPGKPFPTPGYPVPESGPGRPSKQLSALEGARVQTSSRRPRVRTPSAKRLRLRVAVQYCSESFKMCNNCNYRCLGTDPLWGED